MPRNQQSTQRGADDERRPGQDDDARTGGRDGLQARQGRARRGSRDAHERHEHRTAKIIELVGTSAESFEDAVRCCIADAAQTTRGITGAQVKGWSVKCDDGEITEYKAHVAIAFGVERT